MLRKTDTWTGCYDLGWGDLLVPAAYSHPAKMSRSLVFKIIAHALEEGWILPGQTILDPFAGVGTTALPTLMAGLNYIGCELEPKFVDLGCQNIALWNSRFSGMPKWTGSAQIIQGDSRRLAEVVKGAGLVVSSPPYSESIKGVRSEASIEGDRKHRLAIGRNPESGGSLPMNSYGPTPGQLATLPPGIPPTAIVSSPPFAGNSGGRGEASRNGIDPGLFDRHSGGMIGGMGDEPGNLGNLPTGAPPVAIVSSPPYVDSMEKSGGIDPAKSNHIGGPHSQMNRSDTRYGEADGQLGAMKPGEISAVIASPPFADSVGSDDPDKRGGLFRDAKRRNDTNLTGTYGQTEGQLGGMVVGSPPFEGSLDRGVVNAAARRDFARANGVSNAEHISPIDMEKVGLRNQPDYGSTAGQIGATQGDTFWASAKTIIDQCYQILPPNACAIWVLKAYVKGGKIVDFPGQWQQLCESCGFETVHVHQAMLVKHQGVQQGAMEGESVSKEVSHKSFFRRLSERRGAPKIDFETVLCMVKPA